MSAPLLTIAAGGTGGHMFPAQALAEEMLARGWRVHLSTDARGARYAGGFPDAVERRVVSAATFARGGLSALTAPLRILAGALSAVRRMRAEQPDCVAGFGGYPAFPAMTAAWILNRPRLIHEQNGVLGRVNEIFARRVDRVACGTWPTALPKGVAAVHTGNPVRRAVADRAGAPYAPPGDGPINVLVIGGSQGAHILSRVAPAALAMLPGPLKSRLTVAHQARPEDLEAAVAAYEKAGLPAEVAPFFHDVAERLEAAQLVVSRSGASTVADLGTVGRPSILIPFAGAKRDEQTANARGPVAAGAALVIAEADLSAERLANDIAAILGDAARMTAMAAAARAQGVPNAAERLADLIETLAERPDAPRAGIRERETS